MEIATAKKNKKTNRSDDDFETKSRSDKKELLLNQANIKVEISLINLEQKLHNVHIPDLPHRTGSRSETSTREDRSPQVQIGTYEAG
jgi:hypothetical protein